VETQECFFAPSLAVKVNLASASCFVFPESKASFMSRVFLSPANNRLLVCAEPGNRAQIRAQGIDAAMPPLVNPLPYRIITPDISSLRSR
jgi:hypothetical protein